jgi:hypothetical protein
MYHLANAIDLIKASDVKSDYILRSAIGALIRIGKGEGREATYVVWHWWSISEVCLLVKDPLLGKRDE